MLAEGILAALVLSGLLFAIVCLREYGRWS